MKYIVIIIFVLNFSTLFAKGVKAGTVIQNSATLNFSLGEEKLIAKSNIEKSVVAQLLDVKVSWVDTAAIVVHEGEKKKVLSYRVMNNGNGSDRYTLIADELSNKSDFSLKRIRVYLDRNKNFRFDSEDSVRKTIRLEPDQEQMVFVVSQMQKTIDAPSSSENFVALRATSRVGGSRVKGTLHRGKGAHGVDAIDGILGGSSEAEGRYKLLIASTVITKDVRFKNDLITVTLVVSVAGEGSVNNVKIVDAIPNETIYVKNSLRLDGNIKSDTRDSDEGRYIRKSSKNKARVTMSLGVLDTSSVHTITYNLRVR